MNARTSFVQALAGRLPSGAVSTAYADRLAVATDLWPKHMFRWRLTPQHPPELPMAVVWPESEEQVAAVVQLAREEGVGLVPYGAGSSVVGGASPTGSQVVIDVKRMSAVRAIDGEEGFASAQAGIMGERWERILNRAGYTQGHFPSSIYCSTLGGWIAARGAGQMSSRYGKIEDQVLGGRVILGTGELWVQEPGPVRAPDFDALIGCEGVLGIWCEATVRIHPLPEHRTWRGFDFPSLGAALAAAQAWLHEGLVPNVLRIYDPLDSFLHRGTHAHFKGERGPNKLAWVGANFPRLASMLGDKLGGACRCVLGFAGSERGAQGDMALALGIAAKHRGVDLGPGPGEAWYATRYAVSYRQSNAFRAGVAVDTMEVACPWPRVEAVYHAVRAAGLGAGAQVLAHFSHVYLEGCSIYFTYALPARSGVAGYERLWRAVLSAAVGAGANVSHHHGAGQLKTQQLREQLGPATRILVALRRRLDPSGVLNPLVLPYDEGPATGGGAWAPDPGATELVATARPDQSLREVEQGLAARGLSLGPEARWWPEISVLAAARAGWLWRRNPQLGTVESQVWGVDGAQGGKRYAFAPGPRAAVGPDLTTEALGGDVERLWLRPSPRAGRVRGFVGPVEACLRVARAVLRHADTRGAQVRVGGSEGRGWLDVALREAAPAVWAEVKALAQNDGLEEAEGAGAGPMWEQARRLAGTWSELSKQVPSAASFALIACDAVGAVGAIWGDTEYNTASGFYRKEIDAVASASGEPVKEGALAVAPEPLRLAEHAAPLDNCTYCPKLCRFSCPVAVAHGGETFTPRQLMLTANLSRREGLPLTESTAAALWSCVDCGSCRTFCDHDNDVPTVLMEARAQLVSQGAVPENVREALAGLATGARMHGPSRRELQERREAVAQHGDNPDARAWLVLGEAAGQSEIEAGIAALRLAKHRLGSVHVPELPPVGHGLWRWGDREAFREHARRWATAVSSAKRLVVEDPIDAWALRRLFPQVEIELPPVLALNELLVGVPLTQEPADDWALHSCCFSRQLGVEVSDARAVPAERRRAGSITHGEAGCCGGTLLPAFDERLQERVGDLLVGDLTGGGARVILSDSPTCRRRLRERGAEVRAAVSLWEAET